jgi:thiol:disulfide interchange protein DsbC
MIILLSFLIAAFFLQDAYAFPTKDQNCSKCHSLSKNEASALLKTFRQDIKVLNVSKGPVKYLWEVSYESNGKKGVVYIDLPKKRLFTGSLLDIQSKKDLTQDRLSEIKRVNVSQIPLKDALVVGDKKAKHRVIVFDDPE